MNASDTCWLVGRGMLEKIRDEEAARRREQQGSAR